MTDMRSIRHLHLLLVVLLGGLLVLASCSTRGGRSNRSDDDDTTSDDDDSGDDDDTGHGDDDAGDDDTGHGDDDDAGDDDDTGHGDDDAGDDDDTAHGDDDDSTTADDDDTAHGDDDDSTSSGTTACAATPDATFVVVPGSPSTTTIDLSANGTPTASLSCSSGGGNNGVVAFVTALPNPLSIAFDHTGGDVQYAVFDALSGTCASVQVDYLSSMYDCVDPIPNVTGTLTFTPTTAGSYVLVLSAYEAGAEASTTITITQ